MGKVVNPTVASAVRKAMALNNVTASDIAEKLNQTTQAVYNRISSGKFTYNVAKQWSDIIGCPVSVFLQGDDFVDTLACLQADIELLKQKNIEIQKRLKIVEDALKGF